MKESINELRIWEQNYSHGAKTTYTIQRYEDVRSLWQKLTWSLRRGAGDGKEWVDQFTYIYDVKVRCTYDSKEKAISGIKMFAKPTTSRCHYIDCSNIN